MTDQPTVTVEQALRILGANNAFLPSDGGFAHACVALLRVGQPLTAEKRGRAYRMLDGYRNELAHAGIPYEAIEPPDGTKSPARIVQPQSMPPQAVGRSKVYINVKGMIAVNSPYALRDVTASISGLRYAGSGTGVYVGPASPALAEACYEAFAPTGVDVDDGVQALLEQAHAIRGAGRLRSRDDLPPVPNMKLDGWLHQRQAFYFARELEAAMLDMEMGQQPHRTPVLTPSGWRRFGDLVVGDEVIGSDGRAHRVLAIKEFDALELVRVVLNDGAVIECADVHPWTVRRTQGPLTTVTAAQIEASLLLERHRRLWLLPDLEPVQFPEVEVPLDPYVLGVLLADGSFTQCCANRGPYPARFTTSKPGVAAEVDERTPGWRLADYGDESHYALWPAGEVRAVVHALGLCGVGSRDKFVPEAYLLGSVAQRRDLLRGLMLDGGGAGVSPEFCTTSKRLAHDVSELARSLGGAGRVREYQRPDCIDYRVTLGLPGWGKRFSRRIVEVQRTGIVEPMRCIEVDVEDHLYVTAGWALTHNTGKSFVVASLIVNSGAMSSLIVCPNRVVGVWPKQFRLHAGREVHVIDPRVEKLDRRKNPTGVFNLLPIKDRVALYDQALNECGCGLPHVLLANYASTALEPFKSWALRQRFDYAAYDESHKLKAGGGAWSRWAQRMVKATGARIGGTGTLQPQTPLDVFGQFRALDPGIFGTSEAAFRKKYARMGGFNDHQVLGMRPEMEAELADKIALITYRVGAEVLDLPDEVPPVRLTCQLSPAAMRTYKQVEEEMYAEVINEMSSGMGFDDAITCDNVLVKILRCMQITGGAVKLDSGDVMKIDQSKADLLKEDLEDIPQREPVVVFARFRHDLDEIERVAGELGRSYHELSGRRDDALTVDATLHEDVQVAGVQIQSGGTGLDMTRSAYAVYYSVGHSLSDFQQSKARLRRPGQTRSVRFRYLVAEGTIDEEVYAALKRNESITKRIGEMIMRRQRGHA